MHKIAVNVTEYLIANQIANKENKEEYIFGLEVFGLKAINYATLFILAASLKVLIPTLFFMVAFLSLRGRTGGFHANTAWKCYLSTIAIFLVIVLVIAPIFTNYGWLMNTCLIIAASSIFCLAPVNHKNINLTNEEFLNCKIASRILIILFISILIALSFIGINPVCIAFAVSGIAMDAGLLIIQKMKEGEKEYEQQS